MQELSNEDQSCLKDIRRHYTAKSTVTARASPSVRCILCKRNHRIMCQVSNENSPTQQAKLVVEAKLCFLCLGENTCYGGAKIRGHLGKMVATVPITHFFIEMGEFIHRNPLQTTTLKYCGRKSK